jgi:hypothetical protein
MNTGTSEWLEACPKCHGTVGHRINCPDGIAFSDKGKMESFIGDYSKSEDQVISRMATEILDLLERVNRRAEYEWIDAKEELPKQHGQYIVYVKLKSLIGGDWATRQVYECVFSEFGFHTANEVLFWTNMPIPPEGTI